MQKQPSLKNQTNSIPKPKKKKQEFHWPKITIPKNPFSQRNIDDPETRKKKIMALKPSKKFHDFHTINWLRTRYNEKVIEKSIYSLFPDNCRPVIPDDESEEDKKHRLLMEWLHNYCQPRDPFKNVELNPKYFFNDKMFEKVLKLKEIFLEFDEDGSRAMEIDEMVEMFNQNNISATMDELVTLFFKGKKFKPEDIEKLYLNFYQFMMFSLTKEQDFREFMRKIKEKYKKTGIAENQSVYLPMNFNYLLDYFINKGKERNSVDIIEKAVEEMDKIINENENDEEEEKKGKKVNKNKYDDQFKNINFEQIMEEFANLFKINIDLGQSNNQSSGLKSKRKTTGSFLTTKKNLTRKTSDKFETNEKESISNEEDDNNNILSMMVNNQINKNYIYKLNVENYNKFHDLKLALKETKNQLNDPDFIIKRNINKNKQNNNIIDLPNIKKNNKNTKKNIKKDKKDYVPYEFLKNLN